MSGDRREFEVTQQPAEGDVETPVRRAGEEAEGGGAAGGGNLQPGGGPANTPQRDESPRTIQPPDTGVPRVTIS